MSCLLRRHVDNDGTNTINTIAKHMQSICRLRIADFLDEKKIVYRISNFLDRSEQQEIVRIANLKRQLAVITKSEEKEIKKVEEGLGNLIYGSRGYAAYDGKRENILDGGGNQPLTAKGAINMAKGLKNNYNGCDRINFMQVHIMLIEVNCCSNTFIY